MIRFRTIRKDDNIAIAHVIRTVLEEHKMNKPGTVYTDPTTDDLFTLFQTPASHYFIVTNNNDIVGGCGLFPTKGLDQGYAELVKLYVSKEVRGLGLGRKLLQMCSEKAKELGYSHLYLESMPELSNAVDLYKSEGYQKLDAPLGDSGHYACDLYMVKTL